EPIIGGPPAWRRWPRAESELHTRIKATTSRTMLAARTRFQDVFNMEALPRWANLLSPGPEHLAEAVETLQRPTARAVPRHCAVERWKSGSCRRAADPTP